MYKNIIIVPYRDRENHLSLFLRDALPLFDKYLEKPYKVVIVEQNSANLFNRGAIINIGFNEYKNQSEYYFTHDVDIVPTQKGIEELYNLSCNGFLGLFTPPCNTLGCIVKFDCNSFINSNGFPNNIWGWGVEDKSLQNRAETMSINVSKFIYHNTPDFTDYFTRNDKATDPKIQDYLFQNRTNFEYEIFEKIQKDEKMKHILSSGLNNLKYEIVSRVSLCENVELIKVVI